MADALKKAGTWSSIRKQIASLDEPALREVVKDLYQLAAGNRDFLHARFQDKGTDASTLEPYRKKVVEQFFPARGFGKLKLAEARKAIRDYWKATGNLRGTAELLMTFVENGVAFTRNFGDIDAPFYRSLSSVLDELASVIRQDAEMYPEFGERLAEVESSAYGIGWGLSDHLREIIESLDEDLGSAE